MNELYNNNINSNNNNSKKQGRYNMLGQTSMVPITLKTQPNYNYNKAQIQ